MKDQPIAHILTIDVEDWYQSSLEIFDGSPSAARSDPSVVTNTLQCLELLRETKNQATFFVLGSVAEDFPDLVKEILREGHEVGSHGYGHELVYKMSRQAFEEDLKRSLEALHRAGASEILGYRAPYWSITKKSLWALEVLERCGFVYDSSVFPIRRRLYGIPDAPTVPHKISAGLWEFPPATVPILAQNFPVAGGGYLRLLPYGFISGAIRRMNGPGVFYFHPYELDPSDLKLRHQTNSLKNILTRAGQVLGRSNNPQKIKRLLSEHRFTTMEEAFHGLAAPKEARV